MSPLRILSLEDDPNDAELIEGVLEAEGFLCAVRRVETQADFVASLEKNDVDLILADFTLPAFDGMTALKIAQDRAPLIPFIFVSGTLGEEVAIEALKIGAIDYVLKTRLGRLGPSVQRALREAQERNERANAEKALRRSEAYLAQAQRLSMTGSFGWQISSGQIYWSEETFRIFGCDPSDTPRIELVLQRTHPEDRARVAELVERVSRERTGIDLEHRVVWPDGTVRNLHVVGHTTSDGGSTEVVGAVTDVTERKRAAEALHASEERFRQMADALTEVIWITALEPERILYVSPSFERIWGLTLEDLHRQPRLWTDIIHPEDRDRVRGTFDAWLSGDPVHYHDVEFRIVRPDGETRWIHERGVLSLDQDGKPVRASGISEDITDRKLAQENLHRALAEIKDLKEQLYQENVALREEVDKTSMFEEIVGVSPAVQAVLARVKKVAPADSTVLITGETGTGKELIARAIHKRSLRSARAFISVNCAAVPPSLIASELFGHEKGAFTGATQRRMGRFELAEGGTLFLDEVGELPQETQVALLRILQEREFERVGGGKSIRADVRVVAATNRDLQKSIIAGTFRSDLYYRLNVFPIEMPSLRERQSDIPLLVQYFIDRYASKAAKKITNISRSTLDRLTRYDWPGNIRELQNVIERSIILCESETLSVDESWLAQDRAERVPLPNLKRSPLDEREAIETALLESRGRVSGPEGAATRLGLPASTLESKIRTLKINKHSFRANG